MIDVEKLLKKKMKKGVVIEMKITKDDFESYEAVRSSGVTNMFAVGLVSELSGLSKEKIREIMKNYNELMKKYPDVRRD